jgi:hypothetical protein
VGQRKTDRRTHGHAQQTDQDGLAVIDVNRLIAGLAANFAGAFAHRMSPLGDGAGGLAGAMGGLRGAGFKPLADATGHVTDGAGLPFGAAVAGRRAAPACGIHGKPRHAGADQGRGDRIVPYGAPNTGAERTKTSPDGFAAIANVLDSLIGDPAWRQALLQLVDILVEAGAGLVDIPFDVIGATFGGGHVIFSFTICAFSSN